MNRTKPVKIEIRDGRLWAAFELEQFREELWEIAHGPEWRSIFAEFTCCDAELPEPLTEALAAAWLVDRAVSEYGWEFCWEPYLPDNWEEYDSFLADMLVKWWDNLDGIERVAQVAKTLDVQATMAIARELCAADAIGYWMAELCTP